MADGAFRHEVARAIGTALFVVVALYVWIAPAQTRVRALRSRHLPQWMMYEAGGLGQCRVRFYKVEHGQRAPVDRRALLGLDRPDTRPADRSLRGKKSVDAQARRLCALLKVDDFRAVAACATRRGWEPLYDGSENLCVQPEGQPQAIPTASSATQPSGAAEDAEESP